jgi:hypothetical protein
MKGRKLEIENALTELIREAKAPGGTQRVSIYGLAERAGVDRTLLYKTYRTVVASAKTFNQAAAAQGEVQKLLRKVQVLQERLSRREKECSALGRLFVELYHRSKVENKSLQEKLDKARRERDELRRQ